MTVRPAVAIVGVYPSHMFPDGCFSMGKTEMLPGVRPDYRFDSGPFHIRVSLLDTDYVPVSDEKRGYQHRHRDYEFQFVESGSCDIFAGMRHYTLSAGEFILIAPGTYHSLKSISPDFNILTFCFRLQTKKEPGAENECHAEETFRKPVSIRCEAGEAFQTPVILRRAPHLAALTAVLRAETNRDDLLCGNTVCAALSLLFAQVVRAVVPNKALRPNRDALPLDDRRSDIIDDYFSGEVCRGIREGVLAERLGVSRRQLSRIIFSLYGKSFREKAAEARLQIASDFLVSTDAGIEEISSRLGYENPSCFASFFKRGTGLTPTQFRKHARENGSV